MQQSFASWLQAIVLTNDESLSARTPGTTFSAIATEK